MCVDSRGECFFFPCGISWSVFAHEVGEQNEIWNVSAKNTLTMATFLAKTFQIPFCSSLLLVMTLCVCVCGVSVRVFVFVVLNLCAWQSSGLPPAFHVITGRWLAPSLLKGDSANEEECFVVLQWQHSSLWLNEAFYRLSRKLEETSSHTQTPECVKIRSVRHTVALLIRSLGIVVYEMSILHTATCSWYSLEHQMFIDPQLKIVPIVNSLFTPG